MILLLLFIMMIRYLLGQPFGGGLPKRAPKRAAAGGAAATALAAEEAFRRLEAEAAHALASAALAALPTGALPNGARGGGDERGGGGRGGGVGDMGGSDGGRFGPGAAAFSVSAAPRPLPSGAFEGAAAEALVAALSVRAESARRLGRHAASVADVEAALKVRRARNSRWGSLGDRYILR